MYNYDLFVLILCLFIFVLLTGFISYLILHNHSMRKKMIRAGLEDEKIAKDYDLYKANKTSAAHVISTIFNVIFAAAFVVLFCASITINVSSKYGNNDFTTVRVVETNSMAKKDPVNSYLEENNLDDQFRMFDLVVTYKLPAEEDLKLYDIVVYEYEGLNIIHRIVAIEEPNNLHPDCRHFTLRGDANVYNDKEPVLYEQMKAIYRGENIPFIGSVFLFFQSPAGYICILLIVVTCIGIPMLENNLEKTISMRLIEIGFLNEQEVKNYKKLLKKSSKDKK